MKIPIGLAKKLQKLLNGEKISGSKLKSKIVEKMLQDEVLTKQMISSRKSLIFIPDSTDFLYYLSNVIGIADLDEYITRYANPNISRSEMVKISSDSKMKSTRTFKGFPVNCYTPIDCEINGKEIILKPAEGMFHFIYDYENFTLEKNIVIVGVENSENFRFINQQKYLFNNINPFFVSRYPQSKDLVTWLNLIPNKYLHYGDFDFAGINIFINEYYRLLGNRAVFFIPENIETLLQKYGNRKLYDKQYNLSPNLNKISSKKISELIHLFHKYRKVLEQEVLIENE